MTATDQNYGENGREKGRKREGRGKGVETERPNYLVSNWILTCCKPHRFTQRTERQTQRQRQT